MFDLTIEAIRFGAWLFWQLFQLMLASAVLLIPVLIIGLFVLAAVETYKEKNKD